MRRRQGTSQQTNSLQRPGGNRAAQLWLPSEGPPAVLFHCYEQFAADYFYLLFFDATNTGTMCDGSHCPLRQPSDGTAPSATQDTSEAPSRRLDPKGEETKARN
mmetsp:Transcript_37992/g.61224  ORF Transcript_37992/g.61224 Transcript_37992/m.61224 type:complete len:104 (-) Transcript_37992:8-319(-)